MSLQSAIAAYGRHRSRLEEAGVILDGVTSYSPFAVGDDGKLLKHARRFDHASALQMAMDAQAVPVTAPNASIPALLTTFIDPEIVRIPFAPLKIATILGDERKKGDWTDLVGIFPVLETTGDVAAYGDFSNNGSSGANTRIITGCGDDSAVGIMG